MLLLLYIASLLGSFSIGYSLLRIGFPEYQEKSYLEKIGYGYLIGIIIFIPSIISVFLINEKFFFLFGVGSFAFIFIVMLIIRTYYQKKDEVELIKEEKETYIPKKAMTQEEKEKLQKNTEEKIEDDNDDYENYKNQKAKELGVIDKMSTINSSISGKNENGLFIKSYENSNKKEKKSNNQIFKEKNPNVIEELRKKTIGKIEIKESNTKEINKDEDNKNNIKNNSKNNKDEKSEELNKLKKLLAKNKKSDDELEDLEEIDEDF